MHGSVHDFIVSQTVANWQYLPTGFGSDETIGKVDLIKADTILSQPVFPKVLDIGSLDINGSMADYNFCNQGRKWVDMIGAEVFIGIDLVPGRGVDRVMDAHNLEFPDDTFDLVLCMDTLEHDSDIQKTLSEGYRVLKPGGLFLITTVDAGHPQHMQEHPVELPYNFITENQFEDFISKIKGKTKTWHVGCDLFARIEK